MIFKPIAHRANSSWVKPIDPLCTVSSLSDESRLLEHFQMLRHRRTAHRHLAGDLPHWTRLLCDALEDREPGRIT